jgi:hypothetical protein
MLKLLLTQFWFVFLPIIFYFFWVWLMARKDTEGKAYAEHIRKGLLFWAIMLSVMLLIACFIWLGFSQQAGMAGRYVPARADVDGRIISGHVEDDQ